MSNNMADRPSTVNMAVTSENQDLKGNLSREELDIRANSNSPKPLADGAPRKKGKFQITSVKLNDTGDADSIDDLDESHAELTDYTSEFLDTSRMTDYSEQETPSSIEDIPMNSHETRDGKEKSDVHSRFRVVKIETKEPFRRGRWFCHDFLDPQQSVNVDRSDTKLNEDANSGSSSAGSSIHYVHGVDDPSKNPLLSGASGTITVLIPEGQATIVQDMFQPIQPASNTAVNQPSNQQSHVSQGSSSICQSVHTSMSHQSISSAPSVDNMSSIISVSSGQPMQGDIKLIQHSNITGQTQLDTSNTGNVQQSGIFLPHFTTVPGPLQGTTLPVQTVFPPSHIKSSAVSSSDNSNVPAGVHIPSQGQNSSTFQTYVHLGHPVISQSSQSDAGQTNEVATGSNVVQPNPELLKQDNQTGNQAETAKESIADPSISEAERDLNVIANAEALSPALVAAVGDLQSPAEEDKSGTSTVAIDNKIEQAMDLVKTHLLFAVREEVDVLKVQIAELIERNNQLEYENGILRAAASPETLAKLAQPRQQQPPASSS